MQNWDADRYLNSVSADNISFSEEKELFTIIKDESSSQWAKDDAVEKICRSHIRFVSQIANHYCQRCPVDMEDMISAGVIGMMTAIEKFDVSKGLKFTTYAGWWIKMEMIKHIQKNCPVVIPQNIHDALIKIQTAIREADRELSREEIKENLGYNEDQMRNIEKAKVQTFSLQNQKNDGEESNFLEDIMTDGSPTPYDKSERADMLMQVKEVIAEMDDKTREIIMSKFSEEKVRLQDLSDKYGVSIERIRQLRERAIKDLRSAVLQKM